MGASHNIQAYNPPDMNSYRNQYSRFDFTNDPTVQKNLAEIDKAGSLQATNAAEQTVRGIGGRYGLLGAANSGAAMQAVTQGAANAIAGTALQTQAQKNAVIEANSGVDQFNPALAQAVYDKYQSNHSGSER
jgi:hypothetical protein